MASVGTEAAADNSLDVVDHPLLPSSSRKVRKDDLKKHPELNSKTWTCCSNNAKSLEI